LTKLARNLSIVGHGLSIGRHSGLVCLFIVELKFEINNIALSMKERHWLCRSVSVGFNFLVTNEAYIHKIIKRKNGK
jgi:hypothetical protein